MRSPLNAFLRFSFYFSMIISSAHNISIPTVMSKNIFSVDFNIALLCSFLSVFFIHIQQ